MYHQNPYVHSYMDMQKEAAYREARYYEDLFKSASYHDDPEFYYALLKEAGWGNMVNKVRTAFNPKWKNMATAFNKNPAATAKTVAKPQAAGKINAQTSMHNPANAGHTTSTATSGATTAAKPAANAVTKPAANAVTKPATDVAAKAKPGKWGNRARWGVGLTAGAAGGAVVHGMATTPTQHNPSAGYY